MKLTEQSVDTLKKILEGKGDALVLSVTGIDNGAKDSRIAIQGSAIDVMVASAAIVEDIAISLPNEYKRAYLKLLERAVNGGFEDDNN